MNKKQPIIRLCKDGICLGIKRESIHEIELTAEEARKLAAELMGYAADLEDPEFIETMEQMA